MTKKNFFWATAIFAVVTFSLSCQKDNDVPKQPIIPTDSMCLIANQGNFMESNGSFSLYNTVTDSVSNGIFKNVNQRDLAALLVDVVVADDVGIAICNNADKVEFFNPKTFTTLSAPIDTGLVNPRMVAVSNGKAYVSCWGAPDDMMAWVWTYSNSYIAEIDLNTKTKIRNIKCGNEAEGVYVKGNNLYVAVADGVEVYVLPTVTFSKKITTSFTATARRIDEDKNGKIWVSFNDFYGGTAGFAVINPSTQNVEKEIVLDKFDSEGKFALSKDKSQVLFAAPTSDPVEFWVTVSSDIFTINVDAYTISTSPLINGTSLSTIGVNPWNGDIYTANTDFTSNNTLLVYSQNGNLKNTAMVGIAPQKFVFY
jgi:hypothetical protein